MIGAIGLLDHATGIELRLYPLYVAPVALASWRLGLRAGLMMSLLALATWAGSHLLAGQSFPAWAWALNALAHLTAFAVVVLLVVFLQRSKTAERRLARTDPLTGLLNARAFYEVASAEFERQRRYPHTMTLAFVDLDNFKEVNDRHGHKIGDKALVEVATAMRAATRAADILSRLGGDEFALLLPETDIEGARRLLQRLSAGVAQAMAASSWPVSCSIGAVTFDTPPDNVDAIVTAADHLMYRVKASGKSAVRIEPFSPDDQSNPLDDVAIGAGTPR
jgi:diguanylate cyclase (GGDEF)-like protein